MKKLENIQGRKITSAYGGVGSIIETKDNGSLLIDFYDRWDCYSHIRLQRIQAITDERLLNHLRDHYGLDSLQRLLPIPTPDTVSMYYTKRADLIYTMKSRYFPSWFYCPKCRKMYKLEDWKRLWESKFPDDGNFSDNYPACAHCSTTRRQRIHRQPLEQIRFCMASLSGGLEDIPFDRLFDAEPIGNVIDLRNAKGGTPTLTYFTSTTSDGLYAVSIKHEENGRKISLAKIQSSYLLYNDAAYKLVLRNQNHIYYPQIVRSLYIPWDEKLVKRVLKKHDEGKTVEYILDYENEPIETIQAIIDSKGLDFDTQVFHYLTTESNYRNGINKKDDFYAIRYENLKNQRLDRFYAIHRLKETSVIPCFTRIMPQGVATNWWNIDEDRECDNMKPDSVSTARGTSVDYIPAIESYGEGLLFEVSTNDIPESERIIFVHTLSHVIMKELEFQCGYPLTSLKEKIYNMGSRWGILIYTIGGSEGSYGGLVSLLPTDFKATEAKMIDIINCAIERAKDCPNDPICESEGGHCFACTDIPEISCCDWNHNLDRRVLLKYQNPPATNVAIEPIESQGLSFTSNTEHDAEPNDIILA